MSGFLSRERLTCIWRGGNCVSGKKYMHFWGCGGIATLSKTTAMQGTLGCCDYCPGLRPALKSPDTSCSAEKPVFKYQSSTQSTSLTLYYVWTHTAQAPRNKPAPVLQRGASDWAAQAVPLGSWTPNHYLQAQPVLSHCLLGLLLWPTVNHPFLAQFTATWGTF